jgi:hypothetical protein
MKSRFALLASAAAGLVSSFTPSARAQGTASPPVTIARARPSLKLELRGFLRLTGSREYGLAGLNLRLQAPTRLAPYVEGRLGDGVVAARPDGALMIPGTPVGLSGAAGASWMFTRGVDVGVDVRRFDRGYLSVALGWLRSSSPVGGFDANDRQVWRDVSHDAFLLKIGVAM